MEQRLEWGWCPRRKLTVDNGWNGDGIPAAMTIMQRLEWGWNPRRKLAMKQRLEWGWIPGRQINYETAAGMGMVSPPQMIWGKNG
jgi:hypothetical protein